VREEIVSALRAGAAAPTDLPSLTASVIVDMEEIGKLWSDYANRDAVRPGSSWALEPLYKAEEIFHRILAGQGGRSHA
jgi:hypothetical protein